MNIESEVEIVLPAKLLCKTPQKIDVTYDPEKEVTTFKITADTVTLGTAVMVLMDYYEKSIATLSKASQEKITQVLMEAKKQWIK